MQTRWCACADVLPRHTVGDVSVFMCVQMRPRFVCNDVFMFRCVHVRRVSTIRPMSPGHTTYSPSRPGSSSGTRPGSSHSIGMIVPESVLVDEATVSGLFWHAVRHILC